LDELFELLSLVQAELPSRCNATKQLLENLPNWFCELGTDAGIATLEDNLKAEIPEPLRLFYRFPATGCWLCVHYDTDIFHEYYPPDEKLRIVRWYYRPHLVLAQFPHDLSVCAVQLDTDNPRIEWGYEGTHKPNDDVPVFFLDWLSRIATELQEWNPK
jgi:hypothetical protein